MRGSWLVGIATLALGCTSPEREPTSASDRAAATVDVIVWEPDAVPVWSTSSEPVLEIGGDAGFARVTEGSFLGDGSFVVLDVTLQEVRLYDAATGRVMPVGTQGEGPGEYDFPTRVWAGPADSIYVWDAGLRRASVYSPDRTFARSVKVSPVDQAYPVAAGPFPDGDWLIGFHRQGPEPSPGTRRGTTVHWRVTDVAGNPSDALAVTAGSEVFGVSWEGRPTTVPVVFGATSEAAPLANGVVVVGTADPAWRVYDKSGRLRRIIEGRLPTEHVRPGDRARVSARRIDQAPPGTDLAAWRQLFQAMVFAETFPRFGDLRVSRNGEIWLERFSPDWEPVDAWWIFAPTGDVLGSVELPPGFTLLAVSGDQLLGVALDQFDVPVLRVFGLRRDSV